MDGLYIPTVTPSNIEGLIKHQRMFKEQLKLKLLPLIQQLRTRMVKRFLSHLVLLTLQN